MKYYICKNDNGTIVILKEITLVEYDAWKNCTSNLKYYSLANNFRDIAIRNGLELIRYLKTLNQNLPTDDIKKFDTTSVGIESNRLMLNYLVSFRTYVDNLQSYSHHMQNGKKFEKNILNWMYDNESAYAFFSKLRNFATHFGMVFDKITLGTNSLTLECSKEHLLDYNSWKPKDIQFINSCKDDSLPILEYVEHNNVLIMSAYIGFLDYFAADLQTMHNKAMLLMKQYQILNPLFIECESEQDLVGSNMFGIGLEILKKATDELATLPNVKITYVGPEQILN